MQHSTKTVTFVGGPLDGTQKEIESHVTLYKHEQPPRPEDIREGELPIGFFPPFHEYIYEVAADNSNQFIYKELVRK
jgi:hypothetical protein